METVNIHEAKTHLSRLVEKAAKGEPFIIAKAGKPMVKVAACMLRSQNGGWACRMACLPCQRTLRISATKRSRRCSTAKNELLLDTHLVVWSITESTRLGAM